MSQNHDVTVASLVRSKKEWKEAEGIADYCERYIVEHVSQVRSLVNMTGCVPTREPFSMGYFRSPRLARAIRGELSERSYGLILVHCSSMADYVKHVTDVPKLLDFCDMDSQKWLTYGRHKYFPLSLVYYLEGLKLQLAEAELAKAFDFCTTATRAELQTLEGLGTGARTGWFPNGVDLDYFQPTDELFDPDTITFIGRMDYFPNERCMVDFCKNTLPLLREKRPALKLVIVGADPTRAVRSLDRIPGVTVTGSVPDVRPIVLRSALSVAPLDIARGVQNKILESLAMGVPCVCSELASRGVDVVPGEHLLTARTPSEFAEAILKVLNDPAVRSRLAAAGRARMLSHYTWDKAMARLDHIIESLVEGSARRIEALS